MLGSGKHVFLVQQEAAGSTSFWRNYFGATRIGVALFGAAHFVASPLQQEARLFGTTTLVRPVLLWPFLARILRK